MKHRAIEHSESEIEILLIEDDPDDAELTIYSLEKNKLVNHLVHIDDGERALEFLYESEAHRPKLILLDLQMPRVDGVEILKKLKSDPEKSTIPVVVFLATKEGKSYVESFHVKADAYMVKPLDRAKFLAVLSDLGLC